MFSFKVWFSGRKYYGLGPPGSFTAFSFVLLILLSVPASYSPYVGIITGLLWGYSVGRIAVRFLEPAGEEAWPFASALFCALCGTPVLIAVVPIELGLAFYAVFFATVLALFLWPAMTLLTLIYSVSAFQTDPLLLVALSLTIAMTYLGVHHAVRGWRSV